MGFEWVEGLKTFRQHSLWGTADPSQGPLAMKRACCGRQQGRRGREDRCALSQAVSVASSRPTGGRWPGWGAGGPAGGRWARGAVLLRPPALLTQAQPRAGLAEWSLGARLQRGPPAEGLACRGAGAWPAGPKGDSDPHSGLHHHLLLSE